MSVHSLLLFNAAVEYLANLLCDGEVPGSNTYQPKRYELLRCVLIFLHSLYETTGTAMLTALFELFSIFPNSAFATIVHCDAKSPKQLKHLRIARTL
jgi:hypothetical protein